ncbi:hypothetical protein FGIG_12688 [Fasciola gigantica]|uniref:Uncharacterized protein n=1 Tax=Fasciola gigantica TaxID=46835 RepID=A0A504YB26_FASGI|nr:hypothetical protein FGIG_12688 [Fasciola gigantica]
MKRVKQGHLLISILFTLSAIVESNIVKSARRVYPEEFLKRLPPEVEKIPDDSELWPDEESENSNDLVEVTDYDGDQLRNPWEDQKTFSEYLDDVEPILTPAITMD